ncbi:5'-nucleotidase, lipoprotein e(P4) family [uncultured Shewanella sp.]|uniref:5'-nucleotidase, lipoprotein e(P4) family n=1 Tax=uncultured Shewanella sp. TaxID=173975 RepID=UPI002623E4FF|nr:5'-nucleotidase, lipoprotein e(P4) family [uncultured Shewanella sp.]
MKKTSRLVPSLLSALLASAFVIPVTLAAPAQSSSTTDNISNSMNNNSHPNTTSENMINKPPKNTDNLLISAVAWKQTAAEYKALYYQAFNMAKMQVDLALAKHKAGDKPLAVISDLDDTLLNASNYWGYMIAHNNAFFNDPIWDEWVPKNRYTATPGALDFVTYCQSKGVDVFYVSNRDQGDNTYEYAKGNLTHLGFPFVDKKHLIVQRDASNKEPAQHKIMQDYDVVVLLGDNLNDFQRKYYSQSVDERTRLMEEDKDLFGSKFILMPNPTDGHWIRAIFGESEPKDTPKNRQRFFDAATKSAWNGE